MITCQDWREAPAAVIENLFAAECARWDELLGWDCRPACRLLELARQKGDLPGLIARGPDSRVVGWSYFLVHDRALQIGNLVAADAVTARILLDGALCAAETRSARRTRTFLFPALPAIETVLAERGFEIERHTYMRCELAGRRTAVTTVAKRSAGGYVVDHWSPRLIPDVVRLLADAYGTTRQARCFAPDGRLDQWTTYVGQLVQTPACGRFERRLSVVAREAGELVGVVLVTALGDRTAHVAQMAVAPGRRRAGIGARLVRTACERASSGGFDRLTLLVAESNDAARRLYERNGFEPAATFLFGDREGPGP